MTLSVTLNGRVAKLMRSSTQIGAFELDEHLQIQGVAISKAANPAETEKIIRLAASHVAQYMVTPRVYRASIATVLTSTQKVPAIPGLTKADSHRLLDFDNIAQQHARLSVQQLREMLTSVGVSLKKV